MPRRNLVFIMSDQQRRDSMGCYGSDWAQTPNLDALANSGHVFENAYVTQAVCTPARASIMTGLYPHTAGPTVNKLPLSPDIPVLAEMVSEDYQCGYMGKWHLGDDVIRQHGFDVWISTEDHREDLHATGIQVRPFRLPPSPRGKWIRARRRDRRRDGFLPHRQVSTARRVPDGVIPCRARRAVHRRQQ